jgi:hypothetical protein
MTSVGGRVCESVSSSCGAVTWLRISQLECANADAIMTLCHGPGWIYHQKRGARGDTFKCDCETHGQDLSLAPLLKTYTSHVNQALSSGCRCSCRL